MPVRDGLGPARVRLRGGPVLAELNFRFGTQDREVVDADGTPVDETTVLLAGAAVYLYRELPDEVPVPFECPVLHRDDDIVVADFTDRN